MVGRWITPWCHDGGMTKATILMNARGENSTNCPPKPQQSSATSAQTTPAYGTRPEFGLLPCLGTTTSIRATPSRGKRRIIV